MMNKQPRAMMTSAAATLREVWSRQKLPKFFLHLAWLFSATEGSTDVKLSKLKPHVDAPYDETADCSAKTHLITHSAGTSWFKHRRGRD